MNLKHSFYTILILALFTLLVGCPAHITKKITDFDNAKGSDYYLSQANASSGSAKTDWQLLAVQALVKENKLSQASTLLSNLPADLNAKQQKEKLLSQGEIAIKTKRSFSLNGLSPDGLSDSQLFRYYTIKLVLDGQDKEINAQAHDYIELAKYAPAEQQNKIINNTWLFFNKLNTNEVQAILIYANETTLQGWINLLYAYRNNKQTYVPAETDTPEIIAQKEQEQKDRLKQAINDWSLQYSDHPAKVLIPKLTGEQSLTVDNANAKKVALFLPLNGSSRIFGETIRQGYLDAMRFFPSEPQQNIMVLDTTSDSLESLVAQAQQQGAEMIVGPLLKDDVIKIKQLDPTLPVLALNKIDNNGSSSANKICFFALSPEDEAKDAATHIYNQHKTKPLLLVPQTDLGDRVAQSFAKQWQLLSNDSSQVYKQSFEGAKTLSSRMNSGSGINLFGRLVKSDPNQVTSSPTESTNFDSIYVYASYDELTFIKPMIEMKSSWSLSSPSAPTMYTSSKSNSANASTDFYYDMERVQFAEIPMIVNQADITTTIPSKIQNDYSLMRLYAMGIDAWRLANRFNQLNANQNNVLNGMTGQLSTENQCEVTRALTWQQYIRGAAQPLSKSE